MENSFNAVEHCKMVSKKLVEAFGNDDRETTPGTVGSAKEADARQFLSEILPAGMGVGTGFVIDTFGGTSKQQDIIIYEKDICLRFRVSPNSDTAYFPCEGVIATGEVKSQLTKEQLNRAFENIESVKTLKRNTDDKCSDTMRYYGSKQPTLVGHNKGFDQDKNSFNQIFSFIIAGGIRVKLETFSKHLRAEVELREEKLCPNFISIGDDITVYSARYEKIIKSQNSGSLFGGKPTLSISPQDSLAYYISDSSKMKTDHQYRSHPIQQLLQSLWLIWQKGATVPSDVMAKYITFDARAEISHNGYIVPTKNGAVPPISIE